VWNGGAAPFSLRQKAMITHLATVRRSVSVRFEIEKHRSAIVIFTSTLALRRQDVAAVFQIAKIRVRQMGYGMLNQNQPDESIQRRLDMYAGPPIGTRLSTPVDLSNRGEEPRLEQTSVPQASI